MKISVSIITYNEEEHILNCIHSVLSFADEIIIVDSLSNDNTIHIIETIQSQTNVSIKIIQQEFLGHIQQKNLALSHCVGDYILSLDADEMLDKNAITSISELKTQSNVVEGYIFKRLNFIGSKAIKFGAWYPDKKLRLIKNKSAKWIGINPHDKLELKSNAKSVLLNGNILHFSYKNEDELFIRTKKYAEISAKHLYSLGKKSSFVKRNINPIIRLVKHLIFKGGIFHGKIGFTLGKQQYLEAFWKYKFLKELNS